MTEQSYTLTLTQIAKLLKKEREKTVAEESQKWRAHIERLLDRIAKGQFEQLPNGRLHFGKSK